ncbi:universal stress protein [Amnibacterium sp.]|uniref:universal stress protein n=1 Tax=Amnibacterium sp. TaxID=1872496 RepID=UPI0026299559|nr:universal stress protein [Amnibacterium sp.]MCU1472025.1 universal stress protein UspA [Amnibacterium sp.]
MTDTVSRSAAPGGRGPRVVVGVDGSPDSIAALRAGEWAAAARGGTLVAVAAWGSPMIVARPPVVLPDEREAAMTVLREAIEDAFHGRCIVPIEAVVQSGRAAAVLVEHSRDADLLVVGSRGHGGFGGLLVGSVSMACTMHAACPVLVLHDGQAPVAEVARAGGRVVVGVGGSPASAVVLRAAADAAAEMDAELLAVAAWEDTLVNPDDYGDYRVELETSARRSLDTALAEAFPEGRPARLHDVLREGPAARVLVDESRNAELVVVGRSGRSEFAGLLLGSVALPVAEHAESPVLVVPIPSGAAPRRSTGDLAGVHA